jgi:hypothetical protein
MLMMAIASVDRGKITRVNGLVVLAMLVGCAHAKLRFEREPDPFGPMPHPAQFYNEITDVAEPHISTRSRSAG